MHTKKSEILKNKVLAFKVSPPDTTWVKLESKLEKQRSLKKIKLYKYFAYAAVFVAVLGMVVAFNFTNNIDKTDSITLHHTPEIISDLEIETAHGIYDSGQLLHLKMAYKKLGVKSRL